MSAQDILEEVMLEHSGVKGMHWHERLYQYPDGSYTELGKARRRVGYKENSSNDEEAKIGGKAYKDMTRKELRAAKKRARHNEAERRKTREFNRDKRLALDEGNLDFISKNITKFSNEEIDEAIRRYKKMEELKDLKDRDKSKKLNNFIDKANYYLDKAAKASDSISRIYNNVQDSSKKKAEKERSQADVRKVEKELDKLEHPDKYKTKADEYKEKQAELDLKKVQKELDKLENPDKYKTDKDKLEERKTLKELLEVEDAINKIEDPRKYMTLTEKYKEQAERYNALKKKQDYINQRDKNERENEKMKIARDASDADSKAKILKSVDIERDRDDDDTSIMGKGDSLFSKLFNSKSKDEYSTKSSKDLEKIYKDGDDLFKDLYKKTKDNYSDWFTIKGDYDRDRKWAKKIQSGKYSNIDSMVNEIKKKYMKERNMNAKAAEKKAEEFVENWILKYDNAALGL